MVTGTKLLLALLFLLGSRADQAWALDHSAPDPQGRPSHPSTPPSSPRPAVGGPRSIRSRSSSSSSSDPSARNANGQSTGNLCADFGDQPLADSGSRVELSKRVYRTEDRRTPADEFTVVHFPANGSALCLAYCFTFWVADPRNKSHVTVSRQGCWLNSDLDCLPNQCHSNQPPRYNNTHFCCCSGHMCNARFQDVYSPADHTTTSTTQLTPVAIGPVHDHSYKTNTIIITLVSILSVSLFIIFLYLTCRLCLTPKLPASPPVSSLAKGVETPEPVSMDQLKIEEVIVQGRYSEVRRGWLGDIEVAVKIYQPHHRQYYNNERTAFSQPFMNHENVLRFLGVKEQLDLDSGLPQQMMVVTQLMPLGCLSGYLKQHMLDWSTLCHMCLGVARGLAHLHTDIQVGDSFKPAIAHRDLNTRNILVRSDLTCVVADLGFAVGMIGSKIIKNGVAENAEQATLADVGTLRYMAPEVFDGAVNLRDCEASLKQIDVYALGLVIWEMASRCLDLYQGAPVPDYQLPFQAEAGPHPTFEEMQVLVVKYKTRPKFPEVWKDANPAVRSLKETIEDCWDSDAEARLTSLCVQERLADITSQWMLGSKHRGVTPTLNATLNLTDSSPNCPPRSSGVFGHTVVSNGVTYIPSYVDRTGHDSEAGEQNRQRLNEDGPVESPVESGYIAGSGNGKRTSDPRSSSAAHVSAPLITNVGQLSQSSSSDPEDSRVKSWLQDQSVSGSTLDTLLPPTPLEEKGQLLLGTLSSERQPSRPASGSLPVSVTQPLIPPPSIKANNVTMAQQKAVILHPNQGRNPTVERNTHKRSDEELMVSGNVLVGPGNQTATTDCELNNRRSSLGAHSAPANQLHEDGNYDGIESIESSALVHNDLLGHYHGRPRNTPIPYFQNHVHAENSSGVAGPPTTTRPKIANITGNRNSYLRLHGEEAPIGVPVTIVSVSSENAEGKWLKHKLSKFIRPRDFGAKLSQVVFGGKRKKSHVLAQNSNLETESKYLDTIGVPGQYVNNGMDASPVNVASSEVQLVDGATVTRACLVSGISHQVPDHSINLLPATRGRLATTNATQLGVLTSPCSENMSSPSLFPKAGTSYVLLTASDEDSGLSQETGLPLQKCVSAKMTTDYGSMRPVSVNHSQGPDNNTDSTTSLTEDLETTLLPYVGATPTNHLYGPIEDSGSGSNLLSNTWKFNDKSFHKNHVASVIPVGRAQNSNQGVKMTITEHSRGLQPHHDLIALSTVVQSPQNRTISSLHKSPALATDIIPKSYNCSNELASSHNVRTDSQQSQHSLKQPNAIINHNLLAGSSKTFPDKFKSYEPQTLHSSQVLESRPLHTVDKTCEVSQNVENKTSSGVSLPEHQLHANSLQNPETVYRHTLCNNHTPGDSGLLKITTSLGHFGYQEESMDSLAMSTMTRPKSLSLKGHNYNQKPKRPTSASSLLRAMSLCQTSTDIRPSSQEHNKSDQRQTRMIEQGQPKTSHQIQDRKNVQEESRMSDQEEQRPSDQDQHRLHENGNPRRSDQKIYSPTYQEHSKDNQGDSRSKFVSAGITQHDQPDSKDGGREGIRSDVTPVDGNLVANSNEVFDKKPMVESEILGATVRGYIAHAKEATQKGCNAPTAVALTRSGGNVKLDGDVISIGDNSTQNKEPGSGRKSRSAGCLSEATRSANNSKLKDSSDPSDKIRKRIKTPVSFKKNNRFSLYDDRLMTVSLCSFPDDAVDGVDSHAKNGLSVSGQVRPESKMGQEMGDRSGRMNINDNNKMIKSESDLVV